MNGIAEWIAAIGAVSAAALIAFDLGRRATGWGFVLFCAVSCLWIGIGMSEGSAPIVAMNAILLLINGWGVWQYLIHPKNRETPD